MNGQSASGKARRPACLLSRGVEEKVAAYILSAGAAVVALAQPARAQIIYTPTDQVIHDDMIQVDLNHDGQNDFGFRQSTSGLDGGRLAGAQGLGRQARLLADFHQKEFATRLGAGKLIGSNLEPWVAYARLASEYAGYTNGPWRNAKDGYLGLRLIVNGQDHYGWARFSVQHGVDKILLTGYAYNTIANQPIRAGQTDAGMLPANDLGAPRAARSANSSSDSGPVALGVLALGSLGLGLWRPR